MSSLLVRTDDRLARERLLARLSFAFLLDEVTQGVAGLKPLDALLVLAINQANIAPLTRDPAARARYGQLDAPAPDDERRPVSVNAIAASLGVPFETVRRRVKGLATGGVCAVTGEGVVIPASFLASPAYLQSVVAGHERLRRFYGELSDAGLIEALPPSSYAADGEVPIRAAARLLADYLLRASEGLLREGGNVISMMILIALIDAALTEDPRPLSVRAIAQRLRLPLETVRRRLAQLAGEELCVRSPSGAMIPPAMLERPGLKLLFAENASNTQRLLAGLAERGVIAAWERAGYS